MQVFSDDENNGILCKITDFGISKKHQLDQTAVTRDRTPRYAAPELSVSLKVGPSVDAYSFGLIMWELLTGEEVFHEYTQQGIEKAVRFGERP